MRTSPYARREKAIIAADSGSIRQRWEYGRLLLVDEAATTPAGNLRNGVLAELVQAALKTGRKTSRREIQYRLECARAYPAEAQITQVLAQYENWWQLLKARFPPYPADGDEHPYDPRTTPEIERAQRGRNILPGAWEQAGLFERFADDDTLAAMKRYAEEQAELTSRFARRCDDRFAYLDELVKAVDGDLSKTYGEARAALGDQR